MADSPENSGAERRKPPEGRRFPKGKSGNPGGRPKDLPEIRDYARARSPQAIDALLSIAESGKNEIARVMACEAILNRGYGKPVATVELPEGSKALVSGVIVLPPETDE